MSKKLYLSGLIFFAILIIIICWPKTYSPSPKVVFHYSATIDHYFCSTKTQIIPSWYKELNIKKPLLEKKWNEIGPKLLSETTTVVGKPFTYSQLNISIFLCPNLPGMGFPIIIPGRARRLSILYRRIEKMK